MGQLFPLVYYRLGKTPLHLCIVRCQCSVGSLRCIESLNLILKPIQACIYYWISSARKDMPHFILLTRGLQIAENLSVINFIIYAKHGRNYLCEHFFYQEAGYDLFDTALTELRSQIPIKRKDWEGKARNEINRLCVWFHEKTNRNTLAVRGCQKRFQSWADWSNLFEYQSFSFQHDNTTEP